MRKIFIISFSLLVFLISCKQQTEIQKIKIATLKGPSAIGMVKMIDSLNEAEESNIEVVIYNEPIQVRKLMLENEVDFAVLPTTMGAILYNKGVQYQLAAIPVWGTLYLFGNDTTINNWKDLKGKRINLMAKGMTPDVLFRQLLIKNGINPEQDLILDYTFPTHVDLANAVAAGQSDLGVISEPLVSMVMQKNKNVHPIFDLNEEWKKVYEDINIAQTAFMVRSEFAQNNKIILDQVLKSYKQSDKWVNENPEDAAKLIVEYGILPNTEVAFSAIPRSNMEFKTAFEIRDQIEEYLKIFYEMNPDIIGSKIPDDNFYLKY
ncbi:MAG: ABC transporter substrate-binding protein [Bacteroidales bacterium]|nr:ABC transporter substrate-binding protein [Bacteroidales bacterium]